MSKSNPTVDTNTQPTGAYADLKGTSPDARPEPDAKALRDAIKARWPDLKDLGEVPSKNAIVKALVEKNRATQIEAVRQVNSFADQHNWTAPSPEPEEDETSEADASKKAKR